jgi:tetratricopeptide (TPR) repeat protein
MKQTQFDKHNIAWFKIAECVSRGEKERALGVYRLLSHSFNDNAIKYQLEADIYCSFGEAELAIALYHQAMESYIKSQRLHEAAAVGQHLVILQPTEMSLHRKLIQLYLPLGMILRTQAHIHVLADFFGQKKQWIEQMLDELCVADHKKHVQEFISALQEYSDDLHQHAVAYLKK